MSSNSRNSRLVLGVAVLVALVGWLWLRSGSAPWDRGANAPEAADASLDADSGAAATDASFSRRDDRRTAKDPAAADAEAIEYLREQFGATIGNKHSQIKAIEKLISYLMKNYPDDWQQRVQAMLAQAFPGLADQLFAKYQSMEAYNEWLKANRTALAEMTSGEKRDALRDARFRFFGPDAAEIWEESLRHERIYDAMDSINQSPDSTVDDKVRSYVDAINETYGDQAPDFVERRQTELLNNFLTLGTVQDDLHAMTPEARAQQLDSVRGAMGMDDAALGRWRELDDQRDEAWQNGEQYMEKRDEITRTFQGDDQTQRLNELRGRMFGAEADILREEEDSGFFRFGHRRVYGKE